MPIVGQEPCRRQFNLTRSNWLGSLFSHPACFNGPPILLNQLLGVMLFNFYFAIYSWWHNDLYGSVILEISYNCVNSNC